LFEKSFNCKYICKILKNTAIMKEYLPIDYLPMLVQLSLALAFVVVTMIVTHLLGPNRKSAVKDAAWECGIEAKGDARAPISIKYFLVAILFVLFDVEIIFMYPWAVNFREMVASGGFAYFVEMLLFMGLFFCGFYYVIKKGVLKWE
jgi:NADH-quinone oxidoreductase subunit A